VLVSMHRLALVAGPALPRTPPSTMTCFLGCRRGAGLDVTLATFPVVDGSWALRSVLNVRDRQVPPDPAARGSRCPSVAARDS
jgi:hypothetical protein